MCRPQWLQNLDSICPNAVIKRYILSVIIDLLFSSFRLSCTFYTLFNCVSRLFIIFLLFQVPLQVKPTLALLIDIPSKNIFIFDQIDYFILLQHHPKSQTSCLRVLNSRLNHISVPFFVVCCLEPSSKQSVTPLWGSNVYKKGSYGPKQIKNAKKSWHNWTQNIAFYLLIFATETAFPKLMTCNIYFSFQKWSLCPQAKKLLWSLQKLLAYPSNSEPWNEINSLSSNAETEAVWEPRRLLLRPPASLVLRNQTTSWGHLVYLVVL